MRAAEEDCDGREDLDDGCTEDDVSYFTKSVHFAVRALFLVCRVLFPTLCLHDKLIVNGLLTVLSLSKPSTLRVAMSSFVQFCRFCNEPHLLRLLPPIIAEL